MLITDCSSFGNGQWANAPYREVCLSPDTILEERFQSWEDILELRDASFPRDHAVCFRIGAAKFLLDVMEGLEKQEFEDKHNGMLPYNPYFMGREGHEFMKNFVFFVPKNGKHQGMVFRFTAAQEHNPERINDMEPVVAGFIRLLLQGECNFKDIAYWAMAGKWSELSLPKSFPNLPLEELLPRSDGHDFIGINFDQSACEAMGFCSSMVKEFSFTACRFADGGLGLGKGLASAKGLVNLELDIRTKGGVYPMSCEAFEPFLKSPNFGLKSLTVTLPNLVRDSALRDLCGMPGIEYIRILGKKGNIDQRQWKKFLDSKIQYHPTLKTLAYSFTGTEFLPSVELQVALVDMVSVRAPTPLESITLLGAGYRKHCADHKHFVQMKKVLAEKSLTKAVLQSSYRHSLLPRAVHAACSSPDFVLALLKGNADVL